MSPTLAATPFSRILGSGAWHLSWIELENLTLLPLFAYLLMKSTSSFAESSIGWCRYGHCGSWGWEVVVEVEVGVTSVDVVVVHVVKVNVVVVDMVETSWLMIMFASVRTPARFRSSILRDNLLSSRTTLSKIELIVPTSLAVVPIDRGENHARNMSFWN